MEEGQDPSDKAYFRRRAEEERAAASAALDPGAVHAHQQLAQYYERQAKRHGDHDANEGA